MLLDFTKELSLTGKNLKIYQRLQRLFFILAFLLGIYLAILILFPSRYFMFNFATPASKDNSIVNPRDADDLPTTNGKILAEKKLIYDTPSSENFPNAQIDFSLNKNSSALQTGNISVQKSFRAIFYPTGNPIGFKDGSLLKNGADYFIISNGALRKFSSNAVNSLGFSENQFTSVTAEDLKYNPTGEAIDQTNTYPDNSLFKITDNLYMLSAGKLKPFTSPQAFASQYAEVQAIAKDENFLKQYPLDENPIGFADGSLISSADSVFIVSEGKIFPIDNPQTFLDNGFDWNDVVSVSADEFSLYEKMKLFNKSSTHPAGTIFSAIEKPEWFFIKDAQKLPVPSEKILASWLHKKPVTFSLKGIESVSNCSIEKNSLLFWKKSYVCKIEFQDPNELYGNNFRFVTTANSNIQINDIQIEFSKAVNTPNLKASLLNLYNKIISNYYAPAE